MADVKIKLNSAGVRELLKSPAMQGIVKQTALSTYPGCKIREVTYAERCGCYAYTKDQKKTVESNDMLNAL